MKKIFCFAALLCIINHSYAQNTFPTGAGTNVGIGTLSPGSPLDISSTPVANGATALNVTASGSATNATYYGQKINVSHTNVGGGGGAIGLDLLVDRSGTGIIPTIGINGIVNAGARAANGTIVSFYGSKFIVNGSSATTSTASAQNYYGIYGEVANNTAVGESSNSYGLFGKASSISTAYGVYGAATGVTGTTGYGGYFTATGGTTNYGVYSAAGTNYFNGSIGIGTVSPTATLQVVGDMRLGSNGIYTDLKLSTQTPLTGYHQTNVISPLTIPGSGISRAALYLKNAVSVGTTRMDLLVDGNMGIGTTAPISKLQIGVPAGVTTAALSNDVNIFGAYSAGRGNLNIGTTDAAAADKGGMLTFSGESGQTSSPYYFGGIRGAKEGVGTYQGYLAFYTIPSGSVLTERMRINAVGNVGIGTTTPSNPLSVVGASNVSTVSILSTAGLATDNAGIVFGTGRTAVGYDGAYGGLKLAISDNSKPIIFGNSITAGAGEFARFTGTGNLGIGTTDPKTYKLAVNGSVIATSVTVKLYSDWPDYVFKKDYKLPSLVKVQEYINKNGHLPDMPSEKEVADNGLNLGEMNKILTKKVEELTLYLIEQNKRIEKLESVIKKSSAH